MFYSQIILAKKGPLAKVWLAAHGWGDKKLGGRPQIFATDIAASVDSIVHPAVPLALRVSGHLLWGVVRIYSKKVHYLLHDCHQAVLKLKLAFRNNNPAEKGILVIDMDDRRRRRKTTQTAEDVVPHFGEFNDEDGLVAVGAFAVPVAWNEMAMDQEDWMPAEQGEEDEEEDEDSANEAGFQAASPGVNRHLDMGDAVLQGRRGEEEWTAFDPDDDEMEDEEDRSKGEGSHVSDIEVTRAVNESVNSEALQSAVSFFLCPRGSFYSVNASDIIATLLLILARFGTGSVFGRSSNVARYGGRRRRLHSRR
jgi:cohesin complex subunit SCC1